MKVLKTELYDKGFASAISNSLELLKVEAQNLILSPSDANVLVCARTDSSLKEIVDGFHWNLPDGMPSVWVLRWKGAKEATRVSGYAFFEELIKKTSKDENTQHFLCGGAEGVAEQLKTVCASWGNRNICGVLSPPYKEELSEDELKEIAKKINEQNTSVLWVGLGAPKQLYFAHKVSKYTNVKLIVTIGAAFDFHAGTVQKAPSWVESSGLEWLYRLMREPARLSKRYFRVIPKFIYYSILDR